MARDALEKMTEETLLLTQDGYLKVDTDVKEIVYHPTLNVILICTNNGIVKVLDVNSGVILQSTNLSAVNHNALKCKYIPKEDRMLFCDGQAIGARSDYNGVLLLDSILQKTLSDEKGQVILELPLSEAIILKESLCDSGIANVENIISNLELGIQNVKKLQKKGIKAQKWNIPCFSLSVEDIKSATSKLFNEFALKKVQTAELQVVSAIQERISELLGEKTNSSEKKMMASEVRRRETFSQWPHMDYKWALPEQMAQAGFYHNPNSSGDDRALCFTCNVCLVSWERTDEPWNEHERHSPGCPFVIGEFTQNVPTSVTYATAPALDATFRGSDINILGTSSIPKLLPTCTNDGLISVFDVSGKIKRTHSFFVTQFDSHILDKFMQDFGQEGFWNDENKKKCNVDKKVTALTIMHDKSSHEDKTSKSIRPGLICGISISKKKNSRELESLKSLTNLQAETLEHLSQYGVDVETEIKLASRNTSLYLVVYDFMYRKEEEQIVDDWSSKNKSNEISPEPLIQDDSDQCYILLPSNGPSNQFSYVDLDAEDTKSKNKYKMNSLYKNYLTSEINTMFIPPPPPPLISKNLSSLKKKIYTASVHSKLISMSNDKNSEVDASTSTLDTNFDNERSVPQKSGSSISSHLIELQNNPSEKKLNYSKAIQCIGLPEQYKTIDGLEILSITPTQDENHILVTLCSQLSHKSCLLIYELDFADTQVVKIKEEPVVMRELLNFEFPLKVELLPPLDKISAESEDSSEIEGNVVLICVDGGVRIVELATLKTIRFAKIDSEKFIAATYCNSLDRLCAATSDGSLNFFALNDSDNESIDDHDDDDSFLFNMDSSFKESTSFENLDISRNFKEPPYLIPVEDLRTLHKLCRFSPLRSMYNVVAPPCWSEFQQAIRHKRNCSVSNAESLTKTWRLQSDTTTWEEHIFEITLPTSMALGHVDVYFTLQNSLNKPCVEVTLLRQTKTGIGHGKDVKFSVDETVTFDMLSKMENPVVCEEYLRSHNAEILAGPVNLAHYLDLTERSGTITLSSPKMFKLKVRNLLLHIRTVYDKDIKTKKSDSKENTIPSKPTLSTFKSDHNLGCDYIHEISIGIYSPTDALVLHEKTIRSLMLESNVFVQSLIMTVINSGNWEIVKNAMNILIWIASIRLIPNRSNNGESPNQQLEFMFINGIEENIIGLLQRCLIKEDRNIAHKVASYIMTCYYGAKNIKPLDDHYNTNLLHSLLITLENVSDVKSSVGLHWLLSLILKLTKKENEHLIIDKFVSLLTSVSENLLLKSNPYHRILRSRYGLYETPMEVELFDIDPPHFIKTSNPYQKPNFSFFSEGSHNISAISELTQQPPSNVKEGANVKDTLPSGENKHLFKNIACPKLVKGLIETEPLHFTCISTSEGTRLEMADSVNPNIPNNMNNILPIIISNAGKNEMIQKYLEKHLQVFHGSLADLFNGIDPVTNTKIPEAHFSLPMYYQDLSTTKAAIPPSEQNMYAKQLPPPPPPPILGGGGGGSFTNQSTPNDYMQWQQLLLIPSKQEIVVERMHSGARRYVTLDFGDFISLTDILIPACSELVSLTIDVWLFGEEIDAVRLVSASDIGTKNLILTDLEPPPLCKFMKITVVGRYGMTTTRCRIPLGYFYGHLTVLSEDTPTEITLKYSDYEKQMSMLGKLMEDIICRYNLACSKLKDCLQLFLVADTKNSIYLSSCHNLFEDKLIIMPNSEHSKILAAYKETLTYQYQLNTIKNVMKRLESNFCKAEDTATSEESNLSANKLIIIAEGVLEVLLSLDANADINQEMCERLFKGLCISETSRLQLLAAAFLEKSCGTSSFWGNFLADILVKLFSTSCTEIFPQDRLFILLVYLSRKSPERSIIIDAALRVIYETLKPLETNRSLLLAVNVDLSLLSWLLMYLSLQLSFEKVQNDRWDWVLGEIVGKVNAANMKNNGKKKSVKRVASTYGSSGYCILTPGQKNVETEIMDIVSKQGLQKICKNEKPTKIKILKKNFLTGQPKNNEDSKDTNGGIRDFINVPQKMPQFIDFSHCLAVAKILLKFIITMDHSGSADMMLLAFKIVSKLVTLAKVQLSYLLNENQLLELINFALSSKVPWAPFALSCFLQDVLECTCTNQTESTSMDTSSPSTSVAWTINDSISGENEMNDSNSSAFMHIDEIEQTKSKPGKTNTTILGFPISLSSVTESDYSDFEELLDDYDRSRFQVFNTKSNKSAFGTLPGVSAAIDARLENGVNAPIEILLRKLVNRNSQKLMRTIANDNPVKENESALSPWAINIGQFQQECNLSNHNMLTYCFDGLFKDMPSQTPERIENVLHLWLTLNCARKDEKFDSSAIPAIPIKVESVCSLISTLAWVPGLTLTTWCLGFQALTLACNTNSNVKNWFDISGMAQDIINHQDFIQMFLSFLSGNGITFFIRAVSGPTLCKALHDFIVRLQVRCDVVSPSSKSGSLLKSLLLQIVYQLARPSGPIATRMGPLDAQCKLFQSIIYLDYSNIDISIGMSILESVSSLLNTYFLNVDHIKCITAIGDRQSSSNTFGDIFASVLGNDSNRQDRSVSYEDLLINLMRLLIKLIQTPMVSVHLETMDTSSSTSTSQTDECKAEQIQQENATLMPCFADTVLQHYPIVVCLCRCLAACKSSSLCMLSTLTPKVVFSNEPNTVVDAVFYMLTLLAKKSSKKELIMQPLLMFLSQASRISEPFFWFILQVLDNEEAIKCFLTAGGVSILASCVVSSSNTPSTISRSGIISTVMQHFTGFSAPISDQNTSVLASITSKMYPPTTTEEKSSLINFAPYCTITCLSGTSQPADVLIQGITGINHRRARTPLWSYNYYQEETHTELLLQLPSAILLKEVFLQPHAGGLATCPAYVAIETSASGPSRLVPACHPLPTSGLTSIRIHLPTAKVVNCILIRLYKPRVGNSIGLLQIRVLGTFAFGKGFNQNSEVEDESYCNHSLGWLRLLHHCFTLPGDQQLRRQVVECASQVPKILSSCCGLLLVPSHIAPVFLPCLERVLRELALFNAENGATIIRILLDNRLTMLEPAISLDTLWQNRQTLSISGYQLACELLYQISVYQDENTESRVKMLLDWLENVVQEYLQSGKIEECNASYILSITSILWFSNQSGVTYDLKSLINQDFFDQIYNIKLRTINNNLKYAFNSLLCSLCYIHPELFPLLLQKMDIFISNLSPISGSSSMCDDYKDTKGLTDDHKQGYANIELHHHLNTGQLNLSKDQLETLALASRSPSAMQQLLDSGLPKLLNNAINEFCNHPENSIPMAKLEKVIAILQFFTDICDEKLMRDWLGSPDGSSFWSHLLHWLCKRPIFSSVIQSEVQLNLEETCIKFLSKCCLCHNANQTRLAKVLCEVISLQPNGIPGFLRRLILQLFLESEKLPVSIEADETLYKTSKMMQVHVPGHPAFKQVYNRTVLYLSTTTTLEDILEQHVFFNSSYKSDTNPTKKPPLAFKKNIFKDLFVKDLQELSVAAGVTAKDKRAKDIKNQATAIPQLKKKRYTSEPFPVTDFTEGRLIKCLTYSDQALPLNLNLGQLLRLLESKGTANGWSYINLTICQSKTASEDRTQYKEILQLIEQQQPINSALQIFSSLGGLALLAQHLPTVYPGTWRIPNIEKQSSESIDAEWITVDDCDIDDIYEDLDDSGTANPPTVKANAPVSHIPPHSLQAFRMFLKLPGYAEVLLKDTKKALCLLRLMLGVTDDGEGGDIFQSPIATSLPTLPFEVLRLLYDSQPLCSDDGQFLRRISITIGVTQLLLACLGILTHHSRGGNNEKDNQKDKHKEDRRFYWAKGTGFGTGSTQQSWNVEQALIKQKNEEEHIAVLLEVLSSFINPNDKSEEELSGNILPTEFVDYLSKSLLLAVISSYLRNDSVLDMARHIPLYKAVLKMLRALAVSSQLVDLLLQQKSKSKEPSVTYLLKNMKSCVDTYTNKLKIPQTKSTLIDEIEDIDQGGESLAKLLPDIQKTANLVAKVTSAIVEDSDSEKESLIETIVSPEEQYLRVMKRLQFASYEMVEEQEDGTIKFVVSHHFSSLAKTTPGQCYPARVKRIAQETVTLSNSLPLSYSSSVFVRYDTSRLDVMKVLITGPADTPYANGCFELDVFFPPDYPISPMLINLETTGHRTVRFNPNLYNDGKVCLSVLNTWHGKPEEKWNPQTSSFLQVLVSIQSLILVSEPYFNEPGYERARGTLAGTANSKDYNLNICQATVRWAMIEQILNPCPCFKDVIHTHFYMKKKEILTQVENWIQEMESETKKERKNVRSATKKKPSIECFKKIYHQLQEQLSKLKPTSALAEEKIDAQIVEDAGSVGGTPVEGEGEISTVGRGGEEEEEEEDEDDADEESPETPTTPTNKLETDMELDSDLDKDMEKMVNDVCKW